MVVSTKVPNYASLRVPTFLILVLVYAFVCKEASEAGLLMRVSSVGIASIMAYVIVNYFVGAMAPLFLKARMCGKDINKRGTSEGDIPIPESLGLVAAATYIMILCILHLFAHRNGDAHLYTAAVACVTFMTLLGFADDVLDLKWRYKLVLPLVASMPLLVNYTGKTTVILPRILCPLVGRIALLFNGGIIGGPSGRLVDLGIGYYIYMALLSIFCTNAINIYAGINGLEAGQSVVIGLFVAIHNAMNFTSSIPKDNMELLRAHHAFSLDMMMPFITVTLGLLNHNWYPSKVFVGDTFCYFAGMSFAMSSILGHYSTTLLLLFIPQLLNFLYSIPQLFGLVPCPRHRLPKFNKDTGKLEGVKTHYNLVNLVLLVMGPMTERSLCVFLLVFQVVCCSGGLFTRAMYLKYMS